MTLLIKFKYKQKVDDSEFSNPILSPDVCGDMCSQTKMQFKHGFQAKPSWREKQLLKGNKKAGEEARWEG